MVNESVLAKGRVERIGIPGSFLVHEASGKAEVEQKADMPDHTEAIRYVLEALTNPEHGVVASLDQIKAIGHRVVHGGEEFSGSVLITGEVKGALERNSDLAPLHNPPNLMGIAAAEANMPGVPNVGVFDTSFHANMPKTAFLYGLPYELYEKYRIRRYGFHGTSHRYVSERCAELIGKPLAELKVVTAHLGNGCSLAALKDGISVDTSMGFTPLEGVMMGTRSGDFDPSIILYLMQKENLSTTEVNNLLNRQSGMLGISQSSSDMRDIEAKIEAGDELASTAWHVYEYRIRKYIGSYAAALNGLDALVFTAGVGENDAMLRSAICKNLSFLGITLDEELNNNRRIKEKLISLPDSQVQVFVIPTNEELIIARDTYELVK